MRGILERENLWKDMLRELNSYCGRDELIEFGILNLYILFVYTIFEM